MTTQEALYIIAIYKPPKMQVSHFNYILEYIIQKMLSCCLIAIIGYFNINILTKTNQSSTVMNKYNLKLIFFKNTTINDTQINHIWTNAPIQQCHYGMTQAYSINHKPHLFYFQITQLCSPIYITT
jgi:hypothetical protein